MHKRVYIEKKKVETLGFQTKKEAREPLLKIQLYVLKDRDTFCNFSFSSFNFYKIHTSI